MSKYFGGNYNKLEDDTIDQQLLKLCKMLMPIENTRFSPFNLIFFGSEMSLVFLSIPNYMILWRELYAYVLDLLFARGYSSHHLSDVHNDKDLVKHSNQIMYECGKYIIYSIFDPNNVEKTETVEPFVEWVDTRGHASFKGLQELGAMCVIS